MVDTERKKRLPNVAIMESIYELIKKKAEQKGQPIVQYVNEVLLMNIEKDDFLKTYAPYLSLAGHYENTLLIHDDKLQRNAEIIMRDGKLYCTLHEGEDTCIHIAFALALPEIAKLKKNGKIE